MDKKLIIRAWKDPEYRASLTEIREENSCLRLCLTGNACTEGGANLTL